MKSQKVFVREDGTIVLKYSFCRRCKAFLSSRLDRIFTICIAGCAVNIDAF